MSPGVKHFIAFRYLLDIQFKISPQHPPMTFVKQSLRPQLGYNFLQENQINKEDGQYRVLELNNTIYGNRMVCHTGTGCSKVPFEGSEENVIPAIIMVYH